MRSARGRGGGFDTLPYCDVVYIRLCSCAREEEEEKRHATWMCSGWEEKSQDSKGIARGGPVGGRGSYKIQFQGVSV